MAWQSYRSWQVVKQDETRLSAALVIRFSVRMGSPCVIHCNPIPICVFGPSPKHYGSDLQTSPPRCTKHPQDQGSEALQSLQRNIVPADRRISCDRRSGKLRFWNLQSKIWSATVSNWSCHAAQDRAVLSRNFSVCQIGQVSSNQVRDLCQAEPPAATIGPCFLHITPRFVQLKISLNKASFC